MYGKLLAFLRDRRTRSHYFNFSDSTASLTSRDLTMFAYCVARGMDFLVSKKVWMTVLFYLHKNHLPISILLIGVKSDEFCLLFIKST